MRKSSRLQCFVTPEEYRNTVWRAVQENGLLLVREIPGPPPRQVLEVSRAEFFENEMRVLLVLPDGTPTAPLGTDEWGEPARWGGAVLWPPQTIGSILCDSGGGFKSTYPAVPGDYYGEILYNPVCEETFRAIERPLRRLLIGMTEPRWDNPNPRSTFKGGFRYSEGAKRWIENGGSLRQSPNSEAYFLPKT